MPPFVLELSSLIRRARRLSVGDGPVTVSFPGATLSTRTMPADVAVVGLLFSAIAREDVTQFLQARADEDDVPSGLRRIDACAQLARMSIDSGSSPVLALLLAGICDATRKFRAYVRQEGRGPEENIQALERLRGHIVRVLRRIEVLGEAHDVLPAGVGYRDEWPKDAYVVYGEYRGVDAATFLALMHNRIEWTEPYSEHANRTPRQRPSAELARQVFDRLVEQWPIAAGEALAPITWPVELSGSKLRRLVVEADFSMRPPWGEWGRFDATSDRRTFTNLRAAVNRCLSPHEVDHIEFVQRIDPGSRT